MSRAQTRSPSVSRRVSVRSFPSFSLRFIPHVCAQGEIGVGGHGRVLRAIVPGVGACALKVMRRDDPHCSRELEAVSTHVIPCTSIVISPRGFWDSVRASAPLLRVCPRWPSRSFWIFLDFCSLSRR